MSGARIVIDNPASPALGRVADALDGEGRELLLSHIGETVANSTRARADRQVSPDGTPWKALSPAYKRWKNRKRPGVPMLRFDRHMLGDMFAWQVEGDALYVGTNAPYGAAHQFGHTYERPERVQKLRFKRNADGSIGNRFAARGKADVEREVKAKAHVSVLPARPWLGLSAEDEVRIGEIVEDHLAAAAKP